jgi:hypothetical protein
VLDELPARQQRSSAALCAPWACLAFFAALLVPQGAMADTRAGSNTDALVYEASIYVFLPTIDGTTTFPAGGSSVNVDAAKILESLNFTFMGAFDLHRGTWGLFTDLMYVDLGASKGASRDFTIGNIGLPAGTAANLHLDIKAWVWTLAAEYRLADQPGVQVDLLVGTRYLDLAETLDWSITGNLGPIQPGSRTGSSQSGVRLWDAIVGVKGRAILGSASAWSVPFYLDVGAGDSNHTWQVATGVAYSFKWGAVIGMWRYLDYGLSGNKVSSLSLNGPLVGATFRW